MPSPARTVAAALSAAAIGVLSGCSDTVEVTAAGRGSDTVCAAVAAAFPAEVARQSRRTTQAGGTGAWGDPAVVARCGVPALAPTEVECLEVDGVGWIPQALSDGTRFTTFGTDPSLEVLVPAAYAPEPLLLPAFTSAARALPANGLACR